MKFLLQIEERAQGKAEASGRVHSEHDGADWMGCVRGRREQIQEPSTCSAGTNSGNQEVKMAELYRENSWGKDCPAQSL